MDIMIEPSKELLWFCREVVPYYMENMIPGDKPTIIFKEDTPSKIITEFETIKDKIGFQLGNG